MHGYVPRAEKVSIANAYLDGLEPRDLVPANEVRSGWRHTRSASYLGDTALHGDANPLVLVGVDSYEDPQLYEPATVLAVIEKVSPGQREALRSDYRILRSVWESGSPEADERVAKDVLIDAIIGTAFAAMRANPRAEGLLNEVFETDEFGIEQSPTEHLAKTRRAVRAVQKRGNSISDRAFDVLTVYNHLQEEPVKQAVGELAVKDTEEIEDHYQAAASLSVETGRHVESRLERLGNISIRYLDGYCRVITGITDHASTGNFDPISGTIIVGPPLKQNARGLMSPSATKSYVRLLQRAIDNRAIDYINTGTGWVYTDALSTYKHPAVFKHGIATKVLRGGNPVLSVDEWVSGGLTGADNRAESDLLQFGCGEPEVNPGLYRHLLQLTYADVDPGSLSSYRTQREVVMGSVSDRMGVQFADAVEKTMTHPKARAMVAPEVLGMHKRECLEDANFSGVTKFLEKIFIFAESE